MSLNGSGVFVVNSTGQPVVASTLISASVFNAFTADIATALSNAVYKDGQQTITANIPMGGFKLTGLAAGTVAGDSVRYEQVQPIDATLTSLAALGTAADKFAYTTGVDTWAEGSITAAGRAILDDANAAAQRATLGAAATDGSSSQVFSVGNATSDYHAVSAYRLQTQALQAFTTGGSSTAYTLTTTNAVALQANEEWEVTFHTTAGATPTLNRDSKGAKSLKYRDSTGAKQAITSAQIVTGWVSKVVYDGTDYVVREIVPGTHAKSMVRLHTANGYGSTNTKIVRFTTAVSNIGVDITYADSATDGATFTINTSGQYTVSFTASATGGAAISCGISLNSSQLTTNIQSIATADILAIDGVGTADIPSCCSWSGYLSAGDIVRAHTSGASFSATIPTIFTITKNS